MALVGIPGHPMVWMKTHRGLGVSTSHLERVIINSTAEQTILHVKNKILHHPLIMILTVDMTQRNHLHR